MFSGTALSPLVDLSFGSNHPKQILRCLQIDEINLSDLIEKLKITNTTTLSLCHSLPVPGETDSIWTPTIESEHTPGAFMTKTPDEIYNSGKGPKMDVMISFTLQVCIKSQSIDENLKNLLNCQRNIYSFVRIYWKLRSH